jgi:DME family drug/metabolite transporter
MLLQTFSGASLIWFGFLLTQGLSIHLLEPSNLLKVLYMGLFGNLLPYLLFLWSIRHVQAEKAAIVASLEPFIAGVIAWIWLGQSLTLMQIVGGVLIVVAIISLQFGNRPSLSSSCNSSL